MGQYTQSRGDTRDTIEEEGEIRGRRTITSGIIQGPISQPVSPAIKSHVDPRFWLS